MRGTSLSRRSFILMICMLIILVAFSTLIGYVFYSDALVFRYTPEELPIVKRQFFVILITAEAMVAIVLAVIASLYIDCLVTKPIKLLTAVFNKLSENPAENDSLEHP